MNQLEQLSLSSNQFTGEPHQPHLTYLLRFYAVQHLEIIFRRVDEATDASRNLTSTFTTLELPEWMEGIHVPGDGKGYWWALGTRAHK